MSSPARITVGLLVLAALAASAQPLVTISGVVRDNSGAVVPGAVVTITATSTDFNRTATTNSSGEYRITNIPAGTYNIRATAPGFAIASRTNVAVSPQSASSVDLVLSTGNLPITSESIATIATGRSSGAPAPTGGSVRNDYTPCLFNGSDYAAFLTGLQPSPPPGRPALLKIGCSPSLLTWKETSDIFGRRVADRYIAIQVIVRNLDPDHEYLIHDVQVASGTARHSNVQTGDDAPPPSPPDVEFAGVRDRTLVRGVAQRGQAYDRRNFLIHAGEVIGEIASAASVAFPGVDFKNGVSVYRAAFIPGMSRLFPDFTIDQLNRLNDSGFSANTAYKIVVAKNGAVPFVVFVPAEIYAANFKKMGQDDLRAFANRLLVVFAGVHIEPVSDRPSLQSFTCSPLAGGFLDLSKDTDYTCKLTGTNVASISKVRLVSTTDSSEAPLEASVGTDGAVTFNVNDLRKLKSAEYQVHIVDKNGRDDATNATVKLRPAVLKDPTVKCTQSAAACTVTLEGANLARVMMLAAECGNDKYTGLRDPAAGSETDQFRFAYAEVNGKTGCKLTFDIDGQNIDTGKKVNFQ